MTHFLGMKLHRLVMCRCKIHRYVAAPLYHLYITALR
jgi:hypothetical protein